ncbi:unnamed protein product, partial [Amoebophrya sp. A25]
GLEKICHETGFQRMHVRPFEGFGDYQPRTESGEVFLPGVRRGRGRGNEVDGTQQEENRHKNGSMNRPGALWHFLEPHRGSSCSGSTIKNFEDDLRFQAQARKRLGRHALISTGGALVGDSSSAPLSPSSFTPTLEECASRSAEKNRVTSTIT